MENIIIRSLKNLSHEQIDYVLDLIKKAKKNKYLTTIDLDQNEKLNSFSIWPDILPPEHTPSIFYARFFYKNRDLYQNKYVLDMGCGSGIQGLTMLKFGAKSVIFSDISQVATENTYENLKNFNLEKKSEVFLGDLFENVKGKFDIIIFNHPFFACKPIIQIPITMSIFNSGELINRFLRDAKLFLNEGGSVIMPFFSLGSKENNPITQGKKHNYKVKTIQICNPSEKENIYGELTINFLMPMN